MDLSRKKYGNSRGATVFSYAARRRNTLLLLLLDSSRQRSSVKALFGNIFGGCQESGSHKNCGNSVFQISLRSQRQQIIDQF